MRRRGSPVQAHPHGLDLTADGEALLPKAEQVLNAMADLRRSADTQSGQLSGTLRIGTIVDPEFIRLGQLLSGLRNNHPGIVTELVHGISGEILDKLKRRTIDLGFYLCAPEEIGDIPSEQPLHTLKLAQFDYRVIAPVGWEARVANANWAELAALPWIGTTSVSAQQSSFGQNIRSSLRRAEYHGAGRPRGVDAGNGAIGCWTKPLPRVNCAAPRQS